MLVFSSCFSISVASPIVSFLGHWCFLCFPLSWSACWYRDLRLLFCSVLCTFVAENSLSALTAVLVKCGMDAWQGRGSWPWRGRAPWVLAAFNDWPGCSGLRCRACHWSCLHQRNPLPETGNQFFTKEQIEPFAEFQRWHNMRKWGLCFWQPKKAFCKMISIFNLITVF